MMKIISILVVLLMFTGCGLSPQRVDISNPLNSGDGYVMMSVNCDKPVVWLLVHKSVNTPTFYESDQQVSCGNVPLAGDRNVVKLFTLKEGDYYLGNFITNTQRTLNEGLYKFSVRKGVVNYVGRIEIKTNLVMKKVSRSGYFSTNELVNDYTFNLIDNESEDKIEIMKFYSKGFEKLAYHKSLAKKM